jgi:FtsP/CotA-like multicopper oxidase with cupredoxin domain
MNKKNIFTMSLAIIALGILLLGTGAFAQVVCPAGAAPAFPGSDTCILDPLSIPKYVTPLVIPPVMNNSGVADNYDIAVRQFQQQILPGGIWNTINGRADAFPATTLWSYGPAADPTPAIAPDPGSQFNYPAYTIETTANIPVNVRWINELVANPLDCYLPDGTPNPAPLAGSCDFLPHIIPVDQTLHWANPEIANLCVDHATGAHYAGTDCTTNNPNLYTGPVPIVTHVHGAHVDPHSDGYPEAWWLPAGVDPLAYDSRGTIFDDATGTNPGNLGYADYSYVQTQPATTLWYHDHTLGMTRTNVYAGPAGFWLVRGDYIVPDAVDNGMTPAINDGILPGPAPVAGQTVLELNVPTDPVRQSIREIPVVIQDRSFKPNGDLFYPDNRAFFEGLNVAGGTPPVLDIPFVPGSDIAPIWNPEAFFTTMVVNGVTWPSLEVAPALYRLRLLNGCNSRFLNLAMFRLNKKGNLNKEIPFYQIGAEQGFLPQVVEIRTGKATPLPGDGTIPMPLNGTFKDQALLMGLAERADVIVDFRGLKNGTVIQMINTAPDAPFGGFPDIPADPASTGKVMQFVVNTALNGASSTDPVMADGITPNPNAATDPYSLIPVSEPASTAPITNTKALSLNEEESATLCVTVDGAGNVVPVPGQVPPLCGGLGVPMAPKAALLGTIAITPGGAVTTPLLWSDPMTERPIQGDTEVWEIYNLTVDGHPIHLHLVRFEVVDRQLLDPVTNLPVPGTIRLPEPWETGYKDTVISYPGEVTRVKATFDIAGLYVWHCHIVEHEDNEMMRPYCVDAAPGVNSCPNVP